MPQPAFREMTDRDGYWGAKIVASFSDAQIAAAVEAAHYEDPRARDYLVRNLIVRRDKIARYWFDRVAPAGLLLGGGRRVLRFHDLAVDIGLAGARAYDVEVESTGRTLAMETTHVHLSSAELPLIDSRKRRLSPVARDLGRREPGDAGARGTDAEGLAWIVTRVRHG